MTCHGNFNTMRNINRTSSASRHKWFILQWITVPHRQLDFLALSLLFYILKHYARMLAKILTYTTTLLIKTIKLSTELHKLFFCVTELDSSAMLHLKPPILYLWRWGQYAIWLTSSSLKENTSFSQHI